MAKCPILQVLPPLDSFRSTFKGHEGRKGTKERQKGGDKGKRKTKGTQKGAKE
jgi:hypothetical protein